MRESEEKLALGDYSFLIITWYVQNYNENVDNY